LAKCPNTFTFASGFGSRTLVWDEKGSRCKSGTIPVAVNFLPQGNQSRFCIPLSPPRAGWEGEPDGKSQKTCQHHLLFILLSGERQEMEPVLFRQPAFHFSTLIPGSSHKQSNMKKSIFVVAAFSIINQLAAQTADTSYRAGEEVVVTANKFPQKQNQTGKVVTLITRETLQQNRGRTLAAVLNNQAGLLVNGSENVLGTNLSVYTRGASSQYTAILVNGMPVTDPSGVYNNFDLNTLPVEQVERVEVLKGGQSTLYGTDASAGVINIILRKNTLQKWAVVANGVAGSFDTYKSNVNISGTQGGFNWGATYSRHTSEGFSAARDVNNLGNYDRDGFSQQSVNLAAGYEKNQYQVNAFFNTGNYKTDLDDAAFRDDKDYMFKNNSLLAGVQSQLRFGKGAWIAQYSFQRHLRNTFNDSFSVAPGSFAYYYKGQFTGRNQVAETYLQLKPVENLQLVTGVDFRSATYDASNDYGFGADKLGRDSIKNNLMSAYLSGAFQPDKAVNLEAGVRYTNHSEYGSNINWNINPSLLIDNRFKVFANLSTAFRAPSLDELFAPFYGNRSLETEKSLSWDAGFGYTSANKVFSTRVAVFARRVKDVIVYKLVNPLTFEGRYFNANEQQEEGLEAELRYQPFKKLHITANYTNVQGRSKDGTKTEENLFRRPRNVLNAQLQYEPSQRWLLSTAVKAMGKRSDIGFPDPISLGAYYTADLYVAYRCSGNLQLYADVRNITDQVYFDINGYNNRRINVMLGVQLRFAK
jgi:vitamin B12 transporter